MEIVNIKLTLSKDNMSGSPYNYLIYKTPCTAKALSIAFYKINLCIKDYRESQCPTQIPANEKDECSLANMKIF